MDFSAANLTKFGNEMSPELISEKLVRCCSLLKNDLELQFLVLLYISLQVLEHEVRKK